MTSKLLYYVYLFSICLYIFILHLKYLLDIRYLNDAYESTVLTDFDILNWWKVHSSVYPTLARIARDILAIPTSTVASENAFSLGGRVVDPFRASLTPRTVEALVCTNDWLKGEVLDYYKEPTEEDVELFEELEAIEQGKIVIICKFYL